MKPLYKNPIVIILGILSIACFVYFQEKLPSVDLSGMEPGNVLAILGYMSVIILVVEQCIEVFLEDPSGAEKRKWKYRIEDINEQIKGKMLAINPEITTEEIENVITDDKKIIALQKERLKLKKIVLGLEQKRYKRTTFVGFILGLILSFFGIRLLSGIIFNEPQESLSSIQETIIISIDIILTATIIAGGSSRMHRLIKKIREALAGF